MTSTPTDTPTDQPTGPPVRVRIADTVIARVAARSTLGVPGVVALHADLAQALLGIAGSVLEPDPERRPPAGVEATVRDGSAAVSITLVTRLGFNCRDLAQAVQREVAAELAAYTGLEVAVTVTIAEVLLE